MVRVDFKQLPCFNYKIKKRTYDLVSLSEVQMEFFKKKIDW